MDALTDMLDHIRSDAALLGQNIMSPPWSIRFSDEASLTLVTMLRGGGWVGADGEDPVRLERHDSAIVRGPGPFTLTSDPAADIEHLYVLGRSGCTDAAGRAVDDEDVSLGTRTCGTRLDAEDAVFVGTYAASGRMAERVLDSLPRVLVVARDEGSAAPLSLIEQEIVRDAPGQPAVLNRLLDLLLIGTLRNWFAHPGGRAPAWYRHADDAIVGPVLDAIHNDPAQGWDVDSLARLARVSRATLARRFTDLMGEPPIAYLTSWRLTLAADLLERSDQTLESIARQVGYSSAYALSTAFMRRYGVRPGRHRTRATAPTAARA